MSIGEMRQRYIEQMKGLQTGGDPEAEHCAADDLLCRMLVALGEDELVAEWDKVTKWYA